MPEVAVPVATEQGTLAARGILTDAEREQLRQLQLPEEDGVPLESYYHVLQGALLAEVIHQHLKGRTDYFCGRNMFVYFSLQQAQEIIEFVEGKRDEVRYKGPDLFVVLGVDGKRRCKSWLVWEENDRFPDLIVEIVSPSTKEKDTKDNLELYAKVFRTREYFWYDEELGEWMGYRLQGGEYVPIEPNEYGWRWSEVLGAWLGVSELPYQGWRYRWLRLYDAEGRLVPTGEELAQVAQQLAEAERRRADQERRRAEQERRRAEQAQRRAERERRRAEQEQRRAEREHQRAEQERRRAEQERRLREQEQQRAEQERRLREQTEQRLAELEAELKRLRGEA
jgi:Uma2 family endonuclease